MAIIVTIWIPVIGWVVALVIAVVKGILSLFGGALFGGGKSHAQREAEEVADLMARGAAPFSAAMAAAWSPRELVDAIIPWTTGYCGGIRDIAVMVSLTPSDGPDPAPTQGPGTILVGQNPCYINAGKPYRDWPDADAMTRDDFALALVRYADTDLIQPRAVSIQGGVNPAMLADAEWRLKMMILGKAAAWREAMDAGLTLDALDAIASERRKEPRLRDVAAFFGFPGDWHGLVGWQVQDAWTRYLTTSRNGSLSDFAARLGFTSWIACRDAVIDSYDATRRRVLALHDRMTWMDNDREETMPTPTTYAPDPALAAHLDFLEARVADLERRLAGERAALMQSLYSLTGRDGSHLTLAELRDAVRDAQPVMLL